MFCSKCGSQIAQGAAFCANCGNPGGTPASNSAESAQNQYRQPYQQQFSGNQMQTTSGLAVAAFVMSLILPLVGLIMGYAAKNDIKRSNGAKSGSGLATAAIAIGWIFTIIGIIVIGIYVAYFAALSADTYY